MRLSTIKYILISIFLISRIFPIFSQDIDNDAIVPILKNNSTLPAINILPRENDGITTKTVTDLTDAQQRRYEYRQRFFKRYEIYKKRLETEPDNAELLIDTGDTAQMIAKNDEAIRYYRNAVKIMRKNKTYSLEKIIDIQRKIISIFIRVSNINMAIVEFKTLTQIAPKKNSFHKEFADFLLHHGFPRRAFLEYKKVLTVTPKDMDVLEKILFLRDEGFISEDEATSVHKQ